jgi:hypothetical protein
VTSFRSLELPSRKVCGLVQVYEFVQLAELYYAGSHGMDIMGPANGTNGFKAKGTQMKDKMVHIFPAVLFVFPGWTSVNPDCIHVMKVKEDAVGTGADLIDSGAIFILIPCWNFS